MGNAPSDEEALRSLDDAFAPLPVGSDFPSSQSSDSIRQQVFAAAITEDERRTRSTPAAAATDPTAGAEPEQPLALPAVLSRAGSQAESTEITAQPEVVSIGSVLTSGAGSEALAVAVREHDCSSVDHAASGGRAVESVQEEWSDLVEAAVQQEKSGLEGDWGSMLEGLQALRQIERTGGDWDELIHRMKSSFSKPLPLVCGEILDKLLESNDTVEMSVRVGCTCAGQAFVSADDCRLCASCAST